MAYLFNYLNPFKNQTSTISPDTQEGKKGPIEDEW